MTISVLIRLSVANDMTLNGEIINSLSRTIRISAVGLHAKPIALFCMRYTSVAILEKESFYRQDRKTVDYTHLGRW